MILEASPDSSLLVRAGAATLLYLHIGSGLVALVSGASALVVRKGSQQHRLIGNVFFVSMLIMAAIGAAVSPFLPVPQWGNVAAGVFTFYLVATAWATVKRKEGVGVFEIAAFVAATCIALGGILLGVYGLSHSMPSKTVGPAIVFGVIAAFAAVGDLSMILRGGIFGPQRIVRHLWRMCGALFIAAASLFLGQPKLFSEAVHSSGLLFVPELAVLGALVFWIIRVRYARKGRQLAIVLQ